MKIEKYYELTDENNESRLLISLENIEDLSIALSDVVVVRDKKDELNTRRRLNFINGYLVLNDNSFMNLKGEINTFPNVRIIYPFNCDRANVKILDKSNNFGFIDQHGNIIFNGATSTKPFSCSLAPVQLLYENGCTYWTYIDKDGNIATDERFIAADVFINGEALVFDSDNKWKKINTNFEVIKEESDISKDDLFDFQTLKNINRLFKIDNVDVYAYSTFKDKNQDITKYSISFKDNALGIKTGMFIEAMVKRFNLTLTSTSLEKRFIETIEKVSELGAFLLLNTDNFEVKEAKVREGYKLIDDEGRFIITFDEEDKEMVRKRIK
ncbi:MAG: hypothetical protein E7163_01230 [Firmicutes bacterium]|nr:hypothetical protein [Bacillota bacterium]